MDQGPIRDHGPGTRDQGRRTRDQGPGTTDRVLPTLLAVVLAMPIAASAVLSAGQPTSQSPELPTLLQSGVPIEREISATNRDSYRIELRRGSSPSSSSNNE